MSACLGNLPRAMICFLLTVQDYLFYLNYSVYLQHTRTCQTEHDISFVDHLVLDSSCVLLIVGEHIIQH